MSTLADGFATLTVGSHVLFTRSSLSSETTAKPSATACCSATTRLQADRLPLTLPLTESNEFLTALVTPGTMTHRAFANPPIMIGYFNEPALHAAEIPAANGITTARSLSRIYAATIGELDGVRLLRPETVEAARAVRSEGPDLVLVPDTTRFGTGFMLPTELTPLASPGSFGHTGLGGSLGFADPELELAFGYVMNQALFFPGRVDPRTGGLVAAVLACLP